MAGKGGEGRGKAGVDGFAVPDIHSSLYLYQILSKHIGKLVLMYFSLKEALIQVGEEV